MLDNIVFSQMAAIAECLCAQIKENDLPGLCFCGILGGDGPYDMTGVGDDCEEGGCGQAWVRFVTGYPSTEVGVALQTPNNCKSNGFGYDLEVGITRCVTIPDDGEAMDHAEMLAASQLQIADMLTMQQALLCCNALNSEDFVLGAYIPIGPEGGILGGRWILSITLV